MIVNGMSEVNIDAALVRDGGADSLIVSTGYDPRVEAHNGALSGSRLG